MYTQYTVGLTTDTHSWLSFLSSTQKSAPEIKTVLYQLLFQLLLNNWRYFFPANVLSHMDNGDLPEAIENETEFLRIIEVGRVWVWSSCVGGCGLLFHCLQWIKCQMLVLV